MEKKIITAAIIVASFVVGERYDNFCVANGIKKFHEAGILKFFNGDKEVGIDEAVSLVKSKKW